jgi:hypothetical protein
VYIYAAGKRTSGVDIQKFRPPEIKYFRNLVHEIRDKIKNVVIRKRKLTK